MAKPLTRSLVIVSAAVLAVLAVWRFGFFPGQTGDERFELSLDETHSAGGLAIRHPPDGAVFPPDIPPPLCRWEDKTGAEAWQVILTCPGEQWRRSFAAMKPEWAPDPGTWKTIQRLPREKEAVITVVGSRRSDPQTVVSRGRVSIRTSRDEVDAPLFYREVNLPFVEAVKDPSRIRWRFGSISSTPPPPVVLEGMPVCGNCHSFPRDGRWLAMDVDYANSKGSYVIAPVGKEMALTPKEIITWDDYRRDEGEQTFGLLSQISPDGEVVVSTVKDRSVFVPRPDLEFSQLFFPIKGILAIYDRKERTFQSLPGADDPEYVQSNPTWSPDGRYIVFARAKAYQLRHSPAAGKALLSPEECEEFLKEGKPFRFELYRIPYNGGQGGTAEPLAGASGNDRSNYFPRYSPDGRWIVFCQARNYMLLQPDSELFIIPASGGVARRLNGNTARMNSWHSWSPNSRWLVFSSKANSPYTQLFLTHIDEQGQSSPAICLAHLTAPDRAANIPEFVSVSPQAIHRISARFLNDYSHARAGFVCETMGDFDRAIQEYAKALELNPNNPHAHERLGFIYGNVRKDPARGLSHLRKAIALAPDNGQAHFLLGRLLLQDPANLGAAAEQFSSALRLLPSSLSTDPEYTFVGTRRYLGLVFMLQGDLAKCVAEFKAALALSPRDAELHFALAAALVQQGLIEEPLAAFGQAVALRPDLKLAPLWRDALALNYARAGRFPEAATAAKAALAEAEALGNETLARQIRDRIPSYERGELPRVEK